MKIQPPRLTGAEATDAAVALFASRDSTFPDSTASPTSTTAPATSSLARPLSASILSPSPSPLSLGGTSRSVPRSSKTPSVPTSSLFSLSSLSPFSSPPLSSPSSSTSHNCPLLGTSSGHPGAPFPFPFPSSSASPTPCDHLKTSLPNQSALLHSFALPKSSQPRALPGPVRRDRR